MGIGDCLVGLITHMFGLMISMDVVVHCHIMAGAAEAGWQVRTPNDHRMYAYLSPVC